MAKHAAKTNTNKKKWRDDCITASKYLVNVGQNVVQIGNRELLWSLRALRQPHLALNGGGTTHGDAAQAREPAAAQFHIDRDEHNKFVADRRLRQLKVHQYSAVRIGSKGMLQLVVGEVGAVHVFIEEPVHAMVAVDIHVGRHVLFHHRLEILGAGGAVGVGGGEVLHHRLEVRVWIF